MAEEVVENEIALIEELADELAVRFDRRRVRRVAHATERAELSALHWGTQPSGLVLLHGGSLNAHAWDRMLLLHGLDAVAFDLPGHGHSGWFDDPLYLPVDLAAVLAPAVAGLGGAPVTLVGHSLGGLAALALAAAQPDLVDRVVLVDATPGSTPERSRDIVDFVSVSEFDSFEHMLDHVAAFKPDRDRTSLRRSLLLNAHRGPDGRWAWRHDHRRLGRADRWEVIFRELPAGWGHAARTQCPVLLVKGERSPIVLESDLRRYRALVGDLMVVEIPGAGHNLHGDAPWELGLTIRDFSRLG